MSLLNLTRADSTDSPYEATERNIEVACGYALRSAQKWQKRLPCFFDHALMEEAAIGAVLRAAERYDPQHDNNATFFTYARSLVVGALMEEDRKQRRRTHDISIETRSFSVWQVLAGRSGDAGCEITISDTLHSGNDDGPEAQVTLTRWVEDLFDRIAPEVLDERERGILMLRYLRGMKQKDVAEFYHVTPGRIHQIEEAALKKLRVRVLADGGLSS